MNILFSKILDLGDDISLPMKEIFEMRGFSEVYRGKTSKFDLNFSEEKTYPGQAIIVGYNKDLELNLEQWLYNYKNKNKEEEFTMYTADISDLTQVFGNETNTVQTSGGQINVPSSYPEAKYFIPPFKREEQTLMYSVERQITLPSELLNSLYLPSDMNIFDLFGSLGSIFGHQQPEKVESSCSGRVTVPLLIFTAKGNKSIEYICSEDVLEASIVAQRNFIEDHKNSLPNFKDEIFHARRFLNRYEKLLPQLK